MGLDLLARSSAVKRQAERTAVYIRVSTEEQAKSGYSVPEQRRELLAYADREGFQVVEEDVDEGVSGTLDTPDRPGFRRIMVLAESGAIDAVLAIKRDRLFRRRLYRLAAEENLAEYGVELKALNDTGNRIGDAVLDELAEEEVRLIVERTRAGRFGRARAGKVLPGVMPPYGFRYTQDKNNLEVNEATMVSVRRIIREVSGGASLRSLKCVFEQEGIPSPTGKAHWSAEFVRRVVLKDTYRPHTFEELTGLCEEGVLPREVLDTLDPTRSYGIWWYGSEEVKRTRAGRKHTPQPREKRVAVPVPDAGVPREQVNKARAAIKDNKRPSRAGDELRPLTGGILVCECGKRMRFKPVRGRRGSGTSYTYYVCNSYWSAARRCNYARFHRTEGLEARVEKGVVNLIRDPEILRAKVEVQAEKERERLQRATYEVARWRDRLDKIARKRFQHLDQQAEGLISMEELSTTVVNSRVAWHHTLSDEGGYGVANGGKNGEIVDRGAGRGERAYRSSLCPLRTARPGAGLSARLALHHRAQEWLAVG